MIKINLLPQEMMGGAAPGRGTPSAGSGALLVTLVLVVLFGASTALGGFLFVRLQSAQAELDSVQATHQSVEEELEEMKADYDSTQANMERMQELIDVAETLDPAGQLLWSRKLNMLPLLVPEGVYLTEINLEQQVREKETDESIRRRNQYMQSEADDKGEMPPVVKIPVITQKLTLDGIAYVSDGTDTQRLQQITSFYKNLQSKGVQVPFDDEEKNFMEGFNRRIQLSPVLGERLEGREVSVFSFTMNTTPLEIQ